jgi:HEAT repeat protein
MRSGTTDGAIGRLLAVSVGIAILTAGCTGGEGASAGPDTTSGPDPVAVVEGFDPSINARTALGDIHTAARDDAEALLAVALENVDAADEDVRWAAVYALAITATADDDAAISALTETLGSSDPDERLTAAGSLATLGAKESIPILIDLLDSDAELRYVVLPAWRVAADMLLASTDEDFGILDAVEPEARADAKAMWESWWADRGAELTWDPERGVFT